MKDVDIFRMVLELLKPMGDIKCINIQHGGNNINTLEKEGIVFGLIQCNKLYFKLDISAVHNLKSEQYLFNGNYYTRIEVPKIKDCIQRKQFLQTAIIAHRITSMRKV